MAARHRNPTDGPELGPPQTDPLIRAGVAQYLTWLQTTLALCNLLAGAAFVANKPGTSPAANFLALFAPLPAWSVIPFSITALLLAGVIGYPVQQYAHVLGMFLWTTVSLGAVGGLVTATTTSPTASLLLTALLGGVAGWHAGALLFRRRLARLDR